MAQIEPDRFYSLKEVSDICGVKTTTLRRLAGNGTLDALRLGGIWCMRGDKLLSFLDGGTSTTAKGEAVDVDAIARQLHRAEYDRADAVGRRLYRKGLHAALLACLGNDFLARQVVTKFEEAHGADAGDNKGE